MITKKEADRLTSIVTLFTVLVRVAYFFDKNIGGEAVSIITTIGIAILGYYVQKQLPD